MSSIKETLFIATHPKASLEAKKRQIEVAIELGQPPIGSTFEEFPELSIPKAAKLISEERRRKNPGGGVQLKDWSKADQERLLRGKLPKGKPTHRNL